MNFCIRAGVHNFLYGRAIFLLGTEKHKEFILKALDLKDVGCFALTELNHGSNVKGIET
jgi:acyl-CoA oxidase